jgi:Predicted kinase related to dihydroxyacetone kinase
VTGIDSLRNILELERRKGYTDKAVIGGLDKYLHKQAGQIRQSINNPQLVSGFDELNLAKSNYGSYDVDERKRWMANVLGWLDEMEGKTETDSSQEPVVSRQETGDRSQEPVASSKESGASSQKTEVRSQETVVSSQKRREGLDSPLTVIKGIALSVANKFAKLNVRTVGDLLYFFPRRYVDYSRRKPISELIEGEEIIIVPGGQTMNPSVRELLQAVESAPSDNIILLPNNKNIVSAASQVQSLTSKKVKVVPTRNIPQGIAAFLAFGYDLNLEKNAQAMEKAIKKVKAIEVTRAVRGTRLGGLEIRKGQFIALLNDEDLIARADKVGDVVLEALDKAGAEKAGIVTVYYGAEIKDAEAQEIAQEIRDRYQTEVEVIYGGQPHYSYIVSLE